MDLMRRRRAMMERLNNTECPYIQRGLVLWLDGIKTGNKAGYWVDQISGHEFEAHNGVLFDQNHLTFDRTKSQYLVNDSFDAPHQADGTIEVVLRDSFDRYIIFMPKVAGCICYGRYRNDLSYSTVTPKQSVRTTGTKDGYLSFSNAFRFINGVKYNRNDDEIWVNADGHNYIGCRQGSEYHFSGDLYCLRIYNRYLTETEILSNYAIDQSRFNLAI